MKKAILGKKIGNTRIFCDDGTSIGVTVVEAAPNVITQKKTVGTDGYDALQVGIIDLPQGKVNKPQKGHFEKAHVAPKRVLKEFRLDSIDGYNVGDEIKCDTFAQGDRIDVIGISKGKGTAGTVKRHNTSRGPMSHGSGYHRGVGSMGANSDPGRVFKGKGLPGHMGNERVTVQNLEVVRVDAEHNMILIKGAIPGPKGGVVMLKDTVKNKKGGK